LLKPLNLQKINLAKIFYYILVYPVSLLPLWVLYKISDFMALLFIYFMPYRKKVVLENIQRSFPNNSKLENRILQRKFYKHFCDILIEGIKNLSISKKELSKRMNIKNPELISELFQLNKSVLLVSGHFNNWEWLITSQNFLLPHQAVGIGMPLTSKFWDQKLNERRARFGMKIIHSKLVKEFYKQEFEKPIATLILSDQSPGDSNKAYWMKFLNQETGVLFGCELLAHQHNHAVVFFKTNKIKRGYYEVTFQLITKNPKNEPWGTITEKHTNLLEKAILEQPECWMWSHKRWKRIIPENLEELKTIQKSQFEQKFLKPKT
jgi:Kdo2-lipid IVA lauroyltransferase/acyltransferase